MKLFFDSSVSSVQNFEISASEISNYGETLEKFCVTLAIFIEQFIKFSFVEDKIKLKDDILRIISLMLELSLLDPDNPVYNTK